MCCTINFNFLEEDYNTYKVRINDEEYLVNGDKPSIKTIINNNSTMSISYEQNPIKLSSICITFLLELVKLVFFVFFDIIPSNAWYSGTSIYTFNYKYNISEVNAKNYSFKINNTFLNSKMNYSKKPNIVSTKGNDFEIINSHSSICYYDLQKHLMKYISKLTWLFFILLALIILFFSKMVTVLIVLSIILTVFVLSLIFMSVKKYRTIAEIITQRDDLLNNPVDG